MNVRTPALAVAASLLALALFPTTAFAAASEDEAPFPDDYVAVGRKWVADVRADLERVEGANWTEAALADLAKADVALDAGKLRVASFHVANARAALAFYPLWEEMSAAGSESTKRARALAAADGFIAEARKSEQAFRADLAALDGNLSGVLALEAALFAADWSMEGFYQLGVYETYRRDFIDREVVDASFTLGLVVTTVGAKTALDAARDLVAVAVAREGLLPRLDPQLWTNLTILARLSVPTGAASPARQPFDDVARGTEATGENLLLVGAHFAARRAESVAGVQVMFGDGASRLGAQAQHDLWENINASLAKPELPTWRAAGYEGLFSIDGTEAAIHLLQDESPTLPMMARAWISIEHARVVGQFLTQISTQKPPPGSVEAAGEEPATQVAVPIAVAAGAALLAVGLVLVGRRQRG